MRQLAAWRWQPLEHPGRSILVACVECRDTAPNNDQALRRAGWTESTVAPRHYRCPQCSTSEVQPW